MSDIDELKPCPFCGGATITMPGDHDDAIAWVQCGNKLCSSIEWHNLPEWNTRPIEDALRAELARLTAENQALKSSCLDISAVVSERCGDDEGMAGEPNEDDDTPATYVVKSVFAILEKLDEVAPGWNYPAPPEGEA